MQEVLTVSGLCKQYPAFSLEDVSFCLEEGRIMGMIGRNGAGKTTTLKSMLGFVHPDRGDVRFFGMDFAAHQQRIRQQIGYVSGGVSFYPAKKLRTITGVTRSFYDQWDDQAYRKTMERFQLDENKTPAQLSEGMKVKYALALALSHRAKLLILDEPTSGLDPVSRDELLDVFLQLNREGVTILFSTHIISDLEKCADDILYICSGRVNSCQTLEAFASAYRFVRLREGQAAQADRSKLIGLRQGKQDWQAIIRAQDAAGMPGEILPASLETVMIHLEKEAEK